MGRALLVWNDYRYFPYERRLAIREANAISTTKPRVTGKGVRVSLTVPLSSCTALTYFKAAVSVDTGQVFKTTQARLEETARSPKSSFRQRVTTGTQHRRQATRYSAHGIHEYKGKFNPQVVRAIRNTLALDPRARILDPFCGSGTTLLESAHMGLDAVGVDLNPLAVYIANAKLNALRYSTQTLWRTWRRLDRELESMSRKLDFSQPLKEREVIALAGAGWSYSLPNSEYLSNWFPRSVLAQMAAISRVISSVVATGQRAIFRVMLSDLLRESSQQEPVDLRIRRRRRPLVNFPLIPRFREHVRHRLSTIERARGVLGRPKGEQQAYVGDVRIGLPIVDPCTKGDLQFDAAICSPPYLSALPYIDTQRLSLCALGIVDSGELGRLQRRLIGDRELRKAEWKQARSDLFFTRTGLLPRRVEDFCRTLFKEVEKPGNGFRRRNVPALAYRYFCDMQSSFHRIRENVKDGGWFALVVGRNRTELAGKDIPIHTPEFLCEIAETVGWKVFETIDLETYQRYDLHYKNSIQRESLLLLRNL